MNRELDTVCGAMLLVCGAASAGAEPPARIRAASLISQREPVYPANAKKKATRGAVHLDVTIAKDGHVPNIQVISGNLILVEAAKSAVQEWVYRPTLLNGEPIEVIMEVCAPFPLRPPNPPPLGCASKTGPIN
jgi:protein TonB